MSSPRADLDELPNRSAMSESGWDRLSSRAAIVPWRELRQTFIDAVSRGFSRWISPQQDHYRDQLLAAAGRFDHGVRLLSDLVPVATRARRLRVLDLGSGNGGVSIAFANDPNHIVYAVDLAPNPQARALRRAIPVPFRQIVADGAKMPVASGSMDLVLLIDVLEHLPFADAVGAEIMRVLRPGGRCIVLTPARVPILLGRDPHYGIGGLLLFPNEVQRFIVNHLFRRRIKAPSGQTHPAYDVEHIFWHAREVTRVFPGEKTVEVLYERSFSPPPGTWNWRWIRHPRWVLEKVRYELRRFQFGHIVIHKGSPEESVSTHDRYTTT
jgi:SAM-dependent methyltransferase